MRLIHKFLLVYLIISMVAFGVGGVVIYHIFSKEIERETNFELLHKVRYLNDMIEKGVSYKTLMQDKIRIEKMPSSRTIKDSTVFSDTLAYHRYSKDIISQRKIDAYRNIQGTTYLFSIYETVIEPEDTKNSAMRSIIILFLVLVVFSLILSFFISRWLLSAFHISLIEMKNFSIQSSKPIQLPVSSTYEFKNLNKFINQMTTKAINDYKNLKEFGENLSHEISTPLAVANGKLDLLLQETNLPENQISLVVTAQKAIQKLSKIQRAISLLTKIENSEFANVKPLNISNVVYKMVKEFIELAELKEIHVATDIESEVLINMDSVLAEILFSNLLQNAVKHNIPNGNIRIELNQKNFYIANTGIVPVESPENYFFRFKKNNQSSESLGLGLSIVKKICDISGFDVNYNFFQKEKEHKITIQFQKP